MGISYVMPKLSLFIDCAINSGPSIFDKLSRSCISGWAGSRSALTLEMTSSSGVTSLLGRYRLAPNWTLAFYKLLMMEWHLFIYSLYIDSFYGDSFLYSHLEKHIILLSLLMITCYFLISIISCDRRICMTFLEGTLVSLILTIHFVLCVTWAMFTTSLLNYFNILHFNTLQYI